MLETKSAREMPRYCLPRWRSTRMLPRKWGQASLISASGARISAQNASGSIVSMGTPKSFHTKPASAVSGGGVFHFYAYTCPTLGSQFCSEWWQIGAPFRIKLRTLMLLKLRYNFSASVFASSTVLADAGFSHGKEPVTFNYGSRVRGSPRSQILFQQDKTFLDTAPLH
jgi:hypothetical protein